MSKRSFAEETQAADSLLQFMRSKGFDDARWEPGGDPPDVILTCKHERWAVEVTRGNQMVRVGRETTSRTGLDVRFHSFKNKIEKAVGGAFLHYYLLRLSAPMNEDFTSYRRRVITSVVCHIRSGSMETLKLDPGELSVSDDISPGLHIISGPHQALTPGGSMLPDVAKNQTEMLRDVFDRKRPDLQRLTGYDRRGLIIINKYLFADRPDDIATLTAIILSDDVVIDFVFFSGARFDLIYWRGGRDH